ncbi:MAG: hypothetical protein ACREIB_01805 [Pseudomonadota bacterium]
MARMSTHLRSVWSQARSENGYVLAAAAVAGVGLSAYGIMSAPSGKVPTAVKAQMAEQQRRADQAYNLNKLLQPFVLDQIGLVATYDAAGNITGVTKKPPTVSEQQQAEIQRLAQEKVLKGLKGELDIDPGATRSLNEAAAQEREYLARAHGPDYATGTAGGTALTRAAESRTITESSLRRGEMTAAEAIAEAQQRQESVEQELAISGARGLAMTQMGLALQDPMAETAQFGYTSRARAGRAAGYGQVGAGLLAGAGALYGEYLGRNRPNPAAVVVPRRQQQGPVYEP